MDGLKGREAVWWQVEQMLKGGAKIIQYRDKGVADDEFEGTAQSLLDLVREMRWENRPVLIINDRVEVAAKIDADGVHVGQGDLALREARAVLGPEKIVGVTVTNLVEAVSAELEGADYLGVSAIFTTLTKPEARSIGLTGLRKIVQGVKIPTVAIGGIHEDNLARVLGTGVTGIAVVSEICAAEDLAERTRELREKIKELKGWRE